MIIRLLCHRQMNLCRFQILKQNKTASMVYFIHGCERKPWGKLYLYLQFAWLSKNKRRRKERKKNFNINHGESMLQYHIRHMKLLKCDENNSLSETCTHNTGFKLNIVWYKLLQKYTSTDKDSLVEVTTHGLGRILFSLLRM